MGDSWHNIEARLHHSNGALIDLNVAVVHLGSAGLNFVTPSPVITGAAFAPIHTAAVGGTPAAVAAAIMASPWAAWYTALGTAHTQAGLTLAARDAAMAQWAAGVQV